MDYWWLSLLDLLMPPLVLLLVAVFRHFDAQSAKRVTVAIKPRVDWAHINRMERELDMAESPWPPELKRAISTPPRLRYDTLSAAGGAGGNSYITYNGPVRPNIEQFKRHLRAMEGTAYRPPSIPLCLNCGKPGIHTHSYDR